MGEIFQWEHPPPKKTQQNKETKKHSYEHIDYLFQNDKYTSWFVIYTFRKFKVSLMYNKGLKYCKYKIYKKYFEVNEIQVNSDEGRHLYSREDKNAKYKNILTVFNNFSLEKLYW